MYKRNVINTEMTSISKRKVGNTLSPSPAHLQQDKEVQADLRVLMNPDVSGIRFFFFFLLKCLSFGQPKENCWFLPVMEGDIALGDLSSN